jgi:hypothetical protein
MWSGNNLQYLRGTLIICEWNICVIAQFAYLCTYLVWLVYVARLVWRVYVARLVCLVYVARLVWLVHVARLNTHFSWQVLAEKTTGEANDKRHGDVRAWCKPRPHS